MQTASAPGTWSHCRVLLELRLLRPQRERGNTDLAQLGRLTNRMYLLYLMEGLASEPLIHVKNRVAQLWLSCKSSPWSHTEERTISRLSVYERRCWKGAVAYRTLHAPRKDPCGHKKASTHCSKSCLFCRKYVKSLKLHVKSPGFLMG